MTAGQWLLVGVLAVPAAGALAAAGLPRRYEAAARLAGALAAALAFLASVALYAGQGGTGIAPAAPVQPWHAVAADWVPGLDLQFHLGVDGISYPLVVLTTLLTLLWGGGEKMGGGGRGGGAPWGERGRVMK
jgi:NADH-quinone oxidoreductase subunit M